MNSTLHSALLPIVSLGGLVWAATLFYFVEGQSIGRRIAEWSGWLFFTFLYARMYRISPGTSDEHARFMSGLIPAFTSRGSAWIVLYVLCEFVAIPAVLVYLAITDRELLGITRSRLLVVSWVAVVIFYAYPVAPPWALAAGSSGYGSFPSLHVAEAWIIAISIARTRYAVAWTMFVGIVVVVSRNHYTVDVIAGFALSLAACALIRRGRAEELGIVTA